jgi:hypothetical protein
MNLKLALSFHQKDFSLGTTTPNLELETLQPYFKATIVRQRKNHQLKVEVEFTLWHRHGSGMRCRSLVAMSLIDLC